MESVKLLLPQGEALLVRVTPGEGGSVQGGSGRMVTQKSSVSP